MKAVIFTYSRQGMVITSHLLDYFKKDDISAFVPKRLETAGFLTLPVPSKSLYEYSFNNSDALIFIGSCGIAVREIAPYVHDKRTDPAVICIDELGKFVIPILSGHIGGANKLAEELANHINALPVITTATDLNHKFSADAWASRNGFVIDNMLLAKEVSAAILEKDIPILSDLPVASKYPNGTFPGKNGSIGIYIGWEAKNPFEKTLHIIPPVLLLGIGCRKGITKEAIRTAVQTVCDQYHIDFRGIASAASVDLKSDEPGLLEYCHESNIKIDFYTPDTLRKVQGCFSHSDFVEKITGVDNICERAAMIHSDLLLVPKTAVCGVTVAVGIKKQEVRFE